MGYHLYITRADTWLEAETNPITRQEWEEVVAADASLAWSTEDYYDRSTDTGSIERLYPVLWLEQPEESAFWYVDGAVETKTPDDRTIVKMIELAEKLGARVVGEEDERYVAGSGLQRWRTVRSPD
jgi:hypothetical protein